jgi:fucose permease
LCKYDAQAAMNAPTGQSVSVHRSSQAPLLTTVDLLFTLTGMAATAAGALLPLLVRQWGLTDMPAGSLIAAEYGGSALAAMFAPMLIARRGFRTALMSSGFAIAAGLLLLAYVGWPLALGALLIAGIGIGLMIPAANLLVAQVSRERAAARLNLLNCGWVAGAMAGPLILKLFRQNQRGFLLSIIVLIAGNILALATLRFPGRAEKGWTGIARPAAAPAEVALFGALFFLYVGIEAALAFWVGEFSKRSVATEFWQYAPSLFWGAILGGRAVSAALARSVSVADMLRGGLLVAIGGMAVMLVRGVRPGIALAGLGLACVFPLIMALLSAELEAGHIGQRAAGIIFTAAPVGGVVVPQLVGWISQAAGSLRVGLAVTLVGTVAMLALYEALRRQEA